MITKLTTNDVAVELGITARQLRQFLRSAVSTYVAVGSGARYEFTKADLPTLRRRYAEWSGNGRGRTTPRTDRTPKARTSTPRPSQAEIDAEVWAEEEAENGPVVLPDIRDPRVRHRVSQLAREQEDRLMLRLMAVGLHVTQLGDRS